MKIITTVGTSLVSNYIKQNKSDGEFEERVENLEYRKLKDLELQDIEDDFNFVKNKLIKFAETQNSASAELKSYNKIMHSEKPEYSSVYLIASDTILGRLSAEAIKEEIAKTNDQVFFNPDKDQIKNLQIDNAAKLKNEGFKNLIQRIYEIAGSSDLQDLSFNITGGYKGIIPILIILAVIKSRDIFYIYENTESLIKIPELPIKIDFDFIKNHYDVIDKLYSEGVENYRKFKEEHNQIVTKLEEYGMVEQSGNIADISPIGTIFIEQFKSKSFKFYCTDDIWDKINRHPHILNILKTKFYKPNNRQSKTESKDIHKTVYKDGNNAFRIFFFEDRNNIYIYNTFENHDEYDRYIDTSTKIDKEKIINNSKPRFLEVNHV